MSDSELGVPTCHGYYVVNASSLTAEPANVTFLFPTPHAQAILWSASTQFGLKYPNTINNGNEVDTFQVSNIILPDEDQSVLFGTAPPNQLSLLLQPAMFSGLDNINSGVDGLEIRSLIWYYSSSTPGSQVSSSNYFSNSTGAGLSVVVSIQQTDQVAEYKVAVAGLGCLLRCCDSCFR